MDELFLGTEQYFLRRLQVANWGTFSGIHTVEISERGHLFVGGSGSGKSTLLDAISVLLTPGHINFNAAARQGERRSDRSFMSYVRGAWSSEQDSDGKAATKYLRSGSTWSAVLLTYRSNLGGMLNLMFIGYVRGSSREEAALRKNYFVVPAEFDLQSIADFADADFNVRLVKKRAPSSELFSSFKTYFECF
ncbi:MAG: AAA family ATPase [Duodenibacillus sp.]|nr:AAA family ATPase [Duodenibacillus sp.]